MVHPIHVELDAVHLYMMIHSTQRLWKWSGRSLHSSVLITSIGIPKCQRYSDSIRWNVFMFRNDKLNLIIIWFQNSHLTRFLPKFKYYITSGKVYFLNYLLHHLIIIGQYITNHVSTAVHFVYHPIIIFQLHILPFLWVAGWRVLPYKWSIYISVCKAVATRHF